MKFHLALLLAAAAFAACVTGQDDCDLDNDTAYGGSDILVAGFHNLKDSWEKCQESCQAITNCEYWTYFDETTSSENYCELKFDKSSLPYEGATSGPRDCD